MKEDFKIIYQAADDIIHALEGIGDYEKADYIFTKCVEIRTATVDLQNNMEVTENEN